MLNREQVKAEGLDIPCQTCNHFRRPGRCALRSKLEEVSIEVKGKIRFSYHRSDGYLCPDHPMFSKKVYPFWNWKAWF